LINATAQGRGNEDFSGKIDAFLPLPAYNKGRVYRLEIGT
jgi:hypothetical protein